MAQVNIHVCAKQKRIGPGRQPAIAAWPREEEDESTCWYFNRHVAKPSLGESRPPNLGPDRTAEGRKTHLSLQKNNAGWRAGLRGVGVGVGVGLHGGGIFWFRSDILAGSIGRGAEMQAPAGKSRKHKTVSSKSAPQFEVSLFKRLGVVAMDGERAAGAKPRREGRLRGFGTSGHHASPTRHMRTSATALREATRGQKSEELVLNTSGASDMDLDVTLGSTRPDRLYAVWPQKSRPRTLPVVVLSVTSPWASLAFSSKRWLRGWKTMQSCTRSVPSRVASVTTRWRLGEVRLLTRKGARSTSIVLLSTASCCRTLAVKEKTRNVCPFTVCVEKRKQNDWHCKLLPREWPTTSSMRLTTRRC